MENDETEPPLDIFDQAEHDELLFQSELELRTNNNNLDDTMDEVSASPQHVHSNDNVSSNNGTPHTEEAQEEEELGDPHQYPWHNIQRNLLPHNPHIYYLIQFRPTYINPKTKERLRLKPVVSRVAPNHITKEALSLRIKEAIYTTMKASLAQRFSFLSVITKIEAYFPHQRVPISLLDSRAQSLLKPTYTTYGTGQPIFNNINIDFYVKFLTQYSPCPKHIAGIICNDDCNLSHIPILYSNPFAASKLLKDLNPEVNEIVAHYISHLNNSPLPLPNIHN